MRRQVAYYRHEALHFLYCPTTFLFGEDAPCIIHLMPQLVLHRMCLRYHRKWGI